MSDIDVNAIRTTGAAVLDGATAVAGTAPDGTRERFLIKVRKPGSVWHLEAAFGYVFRPAGMAMRKLNIAPSSS